MRRALPDVLGTQQTTNRLAIQHSWCLAFDEFSQVALIALEHSLAIVDGAITPAPLVRQPLIKTEQTHMNRVRVDLHSRPPWSVAVQQFRRFGAEALRFKRFAKIDAGAVTILPGSMRRVCTCLVAIESAVECSFSPAIGRVADRRVDCNYDVTVNGCNLVSEALGVSRHHLEAGAVQILARVAL